MAGEPFSKDAQLARGERRYRRKVASPKAWQAIIDAKQGPCRVCKLIESQFSIDLRGPIQYHHLLARGASTGGDDVADNIVPLHFVCHECVTTRVPSALAALAASLTHSEYAYLLEKVGEPGIERLFGVPGE